MPPITPNMRIRQVLEDHPATAAVFRGYGIMCEDCHAARYESVGQGAQVHSISLPRLLEDLNRAATGHTPTPRRLPVIRNRTGN